MLRVLFFFFSPLIWVLIAVHTTFCGSLVIVFSLLRASEGAYHGIGVYWGRVAMLLLGARAEVEGLEHIEADRSYVLMANHQSYLDVWTLFALLPLNFRWVVKKELEKIPVFGTACRRMGQIFVDRGNSAAAKQSLVLAGERIRAGTSVAFFPEGTRSRDGQLKRFKKGGFFIALEAGVPILPITIDGGVRLFPQGAWFFRPGVLQVRFHPPIDVGEYTADDKEALMERVRASIAEGLEPT